LGEVHPVQIAVYVCESGVFQFGADLVGLAFHDGHCSVQGSESVNLGGECCGCGGCWRWHQGCAGEYL
jgi:hypothetical protein